VQPVRPGPDLERNKREGSTHKVVAEVGSRYAESPHRSDNERSSNGEQNHGEQLELGVVEEGQLRLLGEGALVEVVAEDSEREDGDGEGVAAPPRVVEREARQDLVAVFCQVRVGRNASTRVGQSWRESGLTLASDNVPEQRVLLQQ
jgi:hypothetical protein